VFQAHASPSACKSTPVDVTIAPTAQQWNGRYTFTGSQLSIFSCVYHLPEIFYIMPCPA
jgi:hypothetical protein